MKVASLVPNNMDQYIDYFYKTDHHWKGGGVLKAYRDIYTLLSQGISGFSPEVPVKGVVEVKQTALRGSFSRRGLYPNLMERISDLDVGDLGLKTFINDKPGVRSRKAQILSGSFKSELFTNYYAEYFGYDFAVIQYEKATAPDRRLLLIGPSYTQALEQIIASHYRETYVLDLRHYAKYAGGQLKLESYIKEHKIDDVLLMVEPQLISDPQWQPLKN
ncbi:MAG: hypothetical protein N2376_09350 [Clostridia bacterium]|nr:hypothetical protein [Clostridia bacterium]